MPDANLPATPTTQVTRELLAILELPGVGVATARTVARQLAGRPSASAIDVLAEVQTSGRSPSPDSLACALRESETRLQRCERLGVSVLSIADTEYPRRLATISDAPPIIYVLGSVVALAGPAVAVVGTREASEVGLRAASTAAGAVSRTGVVVVSGLALGIDTAAHEGALEAGGVTVAVLAHGLDTVTPKSNSALAARIVANRGALVAEHPPGTPPHRAEYVRRNRIQSGLSVCSLMVESDHDGGAIHQGTFTHRQGRPLYVVMPTDAEARGFKLSGAQRLMKEQSAIPVATAGEFVSYVQRLLGAPNAPVPSSPSQQSFGWQ